MAKKLIALLLTGCLAVMPAVGVMAMDVMNTDEDGYEAELRIQNDTELVLEGGGKEYEFNTESGNGYEDLITYYDDNVVLDSGGGNSILHVILPDEDEKYTVRTVSGKAEDLSIVVRYDDKYISADVKSKEIKFSHDGALKVKGGNGDLELTMVDDNIPADQYNTYSVSGKCKGNLTFAVKDDETTVRGTELKGLKITGEDMLDEEKTDAYEIKDSAVRLTFFRKGNELVVEKIVTPTPKVVPKSQKK